MWKNGFFDLQVRDIWSDSDDGEINLNGLPLNLIVQVFEDFTGLDLMTQG